jgi:hypothetical protein
VKRKLNKLAAINKQQTVYYIDSEEGSDVLLRNVGGYLSNYTAS